MQVILVESYHGAEKMKANSACFPYSRRPTLLPFHPPLPTSTVLILLISSYPQYIQPYYNMYMFRQAFCKCNICKCNRPVTITRTLTKNKIL